MVNLKDLEFALKRPGLSLRRIGKFREIMADELVLREVFLEQPYNWLVKGLRENTTAIDIGAYKGESSIYLAMQPKIRRVIAYEPMRNAFEEAKEHIENSPYKNKIRIYNKAVLNRVRISHTKKGGGTPFSSASKAGADSVTVEDATRGLRNVIIKCDCEGDERLVFGKGSAPLDNVYRVQLEYHDTRAAVASALRSKGFGVRIMDAHKGAYYKDIGYICASR